MAIQTTVEKPGATAYRAMLGVEKYLAHCSVEKSLRELIKLHVSQINGCAFCIDMHWKDAVAAGENERRLYSLPAWRETPYFSDRERAGLRLAEELTKVAHRPLAEDVHRLAEQHFNEQELADLAWVVASINAWNRVNIALQTEPGGYQPPKLSN